MHRYMYTRMHIHLERILVHTLLRIYTSMRMCTYQKRLKMVKYDTHNDTSQPRYALARNNLGMLLFRKGKLKEAEEQYLSGLEDNTHNDLINSNLSILRRAMAAQQS